MIKDEIKAGHPRREEAEEVARMMHRAIAAGVLIEVVRSFDEYRAAGDSVAEAARCALYDWDA